MGTAFPLADPSISGQLPGTLVTGKVPPSTWMRGHFLIFLFSDRGFYRCRDGRGGVMAQGPRLQKRITLEPGVSHNCVYATPRHGISQPPLPPARQGEPYTAKLLKTPYRMAGFGRRMDARGSNWTPNLLLNIRTTTRGCQFDSGDGIGPNVRR